MKLFKLTALLAASLVSVAAHAVTKDISVSANIDPTLELVTVGNAPMPSAVVMDFSLSAGLKPYKTSVGVLSNDTSKDVQISLAEDAQLVATNNVAAAAIPLTVSFAGKPLTTATQTIGAKELFGDDLKGGGFSTFEIAAKGDTKNAGAGDYIGTVRLVVKQAATSK